MCKNRIQNHTEEQVNTTANLSWPSVLLFKLIWSFAICENLINKYMTRYTLQDKQAHVLGWNRVSWVSRIQTWSGFSRRTIYWPLRESTGRRYSGEPSNDVKKTVSVYAVRGSVDDAGNQAT